MNFWSFWLINIFRFPIPLGFWEEKFLPLPSNTQCALIKLCVVTRNNVECSIEGFKSRIQKLSMEHKCLLYQENNHRQAESGPFSWMKHNLFLKDTWVIYTLQFLCIISKAWSTHAEFINTSNRHKTFTLLLKDQKFQPPSFKKKIQCKLHSSN